MSRQNNSRSCIARYFHIERIAIFFNENFTGFADKASFERAENIRFVRLYYYPLITRLGGIYAADGVKNIAVHTAERIVVKAGSFGLTVLFIGLPIFPNGGCAVFNFKQPRRALRLTKYCRRKIVSAYLSRTGSRNGVARKPVPRRLPFFSTNAASLSAYSFSSSAGTRSKAKAKTYAPIR